MKHDEIVREARDLACYLKEGTVERDRSRQFPYDGIQRIKDSPLLGLLIDEDLGGSGGDIRDFVAVVEELAYADPSVAQMYAVHVTAILTVLGGADQATYEGLVTDVLSKRAWVANAHTEVGTRTNLEFRTRLEPVGDGWSLTGTKFYCTGSQAADFFVGGASTSDPSEPFLMFLVNTHQPGVIVEDDWSGMGQRTTSSGTVVFDQARVQPDRAFGVEGFISATKLAAVILQSYFTAIFAGIARAALDDGVAYVNERARPWPTAGVERASEDPLVRMRVGEMYVRYIGAKSLLDRGVNLMLDAEESATEARRGEASLAIAVAKVSATEAALFNSQTMFQVSGSSATLEKYGFDRHWRNARTLTLHDAVDHKRTVIGDAVLRHGWPAPGPWS